MTIDDYIDTYKSYANDYEKGRYEMGWSSQQRDYAIGKAREYTQLVEWLEELKFYKEKDQKFIHLTEQEFDDVYNKGKADGIDEFMDKVSESIIWDVLAEVMKRNIGASEGADRIIEYLQKIAKELKEQSE